MDIAEINSKLDMEFLLGRESIPYRLSRGRSGMQLQLRTCPHCGDSRSRIYINAETGIGNCFVCNFTYNKVIFVKEYLNASWRETFRFCEEILREQGWRPRKRVEAAVEEDGPVTLPVSVELPLPEGNIVYLHERGIDGATAKYFHLRLCEFGWWMVKNQDGSTYPQSFENRIIIPVYDLDGSLKTFQGRDITGKAERKYLFPVGLPGTGRYLLNGHNFVLSDEVVMGEGFFDVAAIKIAFDQDPDLRRIVPVGSFGKHLSYGDINGDDQLGRFLQLRGRGLKKVTIMWDGEEKALVAALDAAKRLNRIGLFVRIALLPPGKDPNEVAAETVRDAYYKAQTWTPSLDVKWRLQNPYRSTLKLSA